MYRKATILILAVLLAGLSGACSRNTPVSAVSFPGFNDTVVISLPGTSRSKAETIFSQIRKDIDYMQNSWDPSIPGPLARTNLLLSSMQEFSAPPSLIPLIRLGQQYSEMTGGLYDPAIAKLTEYYTAEKPTVESADNLKVSFLENAAVLSDLPSAADIQINGYRLQGTNPNLKLDFGILKKGYALEICAQLLRDANISNASIKIGPDVRTLGSRSGEPWRAVIPRGDAVGILATLDITNEAVMTLNQFHPQSTENMSSGYPVIDPATGKLIDHTKSVTVIHPDAVHASVAAHALFASGSEKWAETARLLGIEDAVITDASGAVHITQNLAPRLRFVNHDTAFTTIEL
jgi:thiamine biosynthesis lipoprotein